MLDAGFVSGKYLVQRFLQILLRQKTKTCIKGLLHCKDSQTVLRIVNVKPTDFPNGFWIKAGEYSGDYEG